MQQHAASFIAHTEASTGAELPRFIKDEFDAFLDCGIPAHGFLRLRCGQCNHDKLLAFSCQRRGFCPSCGARRMSQTTAHLVDYVIPHVPMRQWVLLQPIPLRVLLAAQPELVTAVLQVVQRVLTRHLKLKTPWRDGTTHLVMSPLESMQRLAALVPRPRLHLIRIHGVLAPNAKLRAMVVPKVHPEQQQPATEGVATVGCEVQTVQARPHRMSWAPAAQAGLSCDTT